MKHHYGLITTVLLLFTPLASANIIGANCADDGDGALVMTAAWDSGISTMNLDGVQHGYPGHLGGSFTTDTELDPTVWIVETIDNSTNFAWTDYHIDMGMDKAFSIVGVIAPPDWIWSITPPTGGQQLPNQPPGTLGWVGAVDYYAGTPIGIGGSDTFGLVVSFLGSVSFTIEQVPTGAPVPVPGAVLLGALGLSFAGWRLRRGTT